MGNAFKLISRKIKEKSKLRNIHELSKITWKGDKTNTNNKYIIKFNTRLFQKCSLQAEEKVKVLLAREFKCSNIHEALKNFKIGRKCIYLL